MPTAPQKEKQRNKFADRDYDLNRRKLEPHLLTAKKIRSSIQWQKFREYFINKNPLCCNPFKLHNDIVTPMKQVHHLKECGKYPELAFDENNCISVCTKCHARIESLIRSGKEFVYYATT